MKFKNHLLSFCIGLLLGGSILLSTSSSSQTTTESLSYLVNESVSNTKTVYLTFDDGPSPNTDLILDILATYDIKASFFVLQPENSDYDQYLIRAAREGHAIGIHTSSHDYKAIYASIDSYVADFQMANEYIFNLTGITPTFFRFPGGSINSFNSNISDELILTMESMNYVYYDWNVDSQDSNPNTTASSIYTNVVTGIDGLDTAMILFHDSPSNENTVIILEEIILYLQQERYTFRAIDSSTEAIQFNW